MVLKRIGFTKGYIWNRVLNVVTLEHMQHAGKASLG
jgi:hypothetical protein